VIGVLLSIASAYVAGTYVGALSVIPWILSLKRRDVGLLAFFVYAVYLGNSIEVSSVYSYPSLLVVLSVSLALVVLLDDILTSKVVPERRELIAIPFVLTGFFLPESLIVGEGLVIVSRLRMGKIASLSVAVVVLAFAVLWKTVDYADSAPVQVAVAAAVGIFVILVSLSWKTFKKCSF